ncbi:cystathionine gamma-synthase [Clostridiales bacterium PH28_bin88]|nr:cystathionine gamma-synthase [Clostridiales bacterium PH28_bin88]
MKISTLLVQTGVGWDQKTGAVSVPIYQSATFRHPALGASTGYDYSRTKNPTRQVLEEAIARLEGGDQGFAFATGMAALSTVLMLFQPGDHLVVSEDLYGGTYRVLQEVFRGYGLTCTYVDTTDVKCVEESLTAATKALLVETPTNPLLKVADLAALVSLARQRGLLTIVDNTFMTPYLQRPLELGADIVVHSATKYLAGHNDLVAGLVVVKRKELGERVGFLQNSVGAVLGPQDSWLLIRGLKTLGVRMDRHQDNAAAIARWLDSHPRVTRVYYPGLPTHPGCQLVARQASGFGGMVSFDVTTPELARQVLERVRLISFAESLGGVETLITYPARQTHCDMPLEVRERLGISDFLLRLSVGIEDVEDLIADLDQALHAL